MVCRPVMEGRGLRAITILDTSVASTNLGDQIIMDAVRRELAALMPEAFAYSVASHEWMGLKSRGLLRRSEVAIAGGSNLLSSRMWVRAVWKLSPLDALLVDNVVLMGCGWYHYQRNPDPYTRFLLKGVLSKKHTHSVRDSYTLKMLEKVGVRDAINTGCPTIWGLTQEHCRALPKQKGRAVVTTLNTYIPDKTADRALLDLLRKHYEKVFVWVQTATDHGYTEGLDSGVTFIPPSLRAYDELLRTEPDLDYVGNRLHGGIRALQLGRRAIIIEIDNRAKEMGKDFGLPTVPRDDYPRLEAMISGPLEIAVTPPAAAIDRWKAQFARG
jgi:polysaccharide pyruvyl transferase WcaK-like protein